MTDDSESESTYEPIFELHPGTTFLVLACISALTVALAAWTEGNYPWLAIGIVTAGVALLALECNEHRKKRARETGPEWPTVPPSEEDD